MRLEALAQTYERDGFAFPVDVVNALEAQEIRDDLELAESEPVSYTPLTLPTSAQV